MTNLAQTPLDPKPFQDDIRVESLIESLKYKQCPHCGKRFRFKRHFGKHLEGHKHHDCKLCDTLLSSRQENARHMLERHCIVVASKSLFKCEYCPKKFVKRVTLHNHYKKHLEGQDVCLVCGEFVESAEELKAHQNKHEQDKEWQCEQCDQWFARRQQYLIHMKSHKKYTCESCGSHFPTKQRFLNHERQVHGTNTMGRPHHCGLCELSFTRPSLLHHHFATHSIPIPKLCTVCQLMFHTARSYSHHLNSPGHLKKASTDTVTCEKCNKSFRSQKVLSQHTQRVHMTTRVFQCDNCDYSTKCKANLARHNVAIHADRKEFICELCGTAFSTLNTLRDHHTYIHSDQRLFPCELCDKTFKRKSELNRHVKIHSDSRPVKCHCGQSYKCVSHLRRHEQKSHNVAKSKKGKKESSSIDRISSKQSNTAKEMSSGNVCHVQPSSSSLDGVTDLITLKELPLNTLSLSHDTVSSMCHSQLLQAVKLSCNFSTSSNTVDLISASSSQIFYATPITISLAPTQSLNVQPQAETLVEQCPQENCAARNALITPEKLNTSLNSISSPSTQFFLSICPQTPILNEHYLDKNNTTQNLFTIPEESKSNCLINQNAHSYPSTSLPLYLPISETISESSNKMELHAPQVSFSNLSPDGLLSNEDITPDVENTTSLLESLPEFLPHQLSLLNV